MQKGNLHFINAALPLVSENHLFELKIEGGLWTYIQAQPLILESVYKLGSVPIVQQENNGENDQIKTIDLEGKVLLPGFVDAHMHLDKSFSLPKVGNVSGTLLEAVLNYSAASPLFSKEEIKSRILKTALLCLSYGTTAIRTHLDFNFKSGIEVAFRTIEAAVEVKQQLKPYLDIQLVPMSAYNHLSKKEMEAVEEAIGMGIDGIGGAPHMSDTSEEDIDFVFKMADKYGTFIDLHTDESDNPAIKTVSHIAKRTKDYGFEGRVTVGHLCSLSAMDEGTAEAAIAEMVDAKLGAVTLPAANMYLQGRDDRGLVRRGITRVRELIAAGVPLAAASDNVQDPFHPFGRGDMLQIGLLTGYAAHMGSPTDLRRLLRMLTEIPAKVIGLQGYGIEAGNQADFVILDARSPEQIFTMLPESRWTFKQGCLIQGARMHRQWSDERLNSLWKASQKI